MSRLRALAIDAAYRRRLEALRNRLTAALEAAWGDVDPDNIAASVEAYVARVTPLIEAGQASVQTLTTAYLTAYVRERSGLDLELDEDPGIVGTTRQGVPLGAAMASIGPMVLSRIGNGATPEDALDTGRYLVSRFGDNELTGVADREADRQLERLPVTGWEGVVAPDACETCQAENGGEHDLDTPIYRHPDCNCERRFITG